MRSMRIRISEAIFEYTYYVNLCSHHKEKIYCTIPESYEYIVTIYILILQQHCSSVRVGIHRILYNFFMCKSICGASKIFCMRLKHLYVPVFYSRGLRCVDVGVAWNKWASTSSYKFISPGPEFGYASSSVAVIVVGERPDSSRMLTVVKRPKLCWHFQWKLVQLQQSTSAA